MKLYYTNVIGSANTDPLGTSEYGKKYITDWCDNWIKEIIKKNKRMTSLKRDLRKNWNNLIKQQETSYNKTTNGAFERVVRSP